MNAIIKLNNPEEVKDFVCAAANCDFDIDISYNHFIVDAKSLLAVLSMDLKRTLSVCCQGYDKQFERVLQKYAA